MKNNKNEIRIICHGCKKNAVIISARVIATNTKGECTIEGYCSLCGVKNQYIQQQRHACLDDVVNNAYNSDIKDCHFQQRIDKILPVIQPQNVIQQIFSRTGNKKKKRKDDSWI